MQACHRCAHPWSGPDAPGFNNTCEKCGISLHCCANCEHYRPQAEPRCGVPDTPRILDATSSNRCESFAFATRGYEAEAEASGRDFLTGSDDDRPSDRGPTWDQLFGG